MEDKNQLTGHSGCGIYLVIDKNNKKLVRKYSSGLEYNYRLECQCDKQASFINHFMKAPKVLNKGFDENGLFYFDMEYIQGMTLSEYMKTVEVSKIKELLYKIVGGMLEWQTISIDNANEAFLQKLSDLRRSTIKLYNPFVDEAIEMLYLKDWSSFKKSYCHGDFTLENILIYNDELYLIDFLDSFFDNWMLDIAAILQDVQCMWSYRFDAQISTNTKLRLMIFRDILIDEICRGDITIYENVYYALLMKLIRIYPYTRDSLTMNYLNKKIARIIFILKRKGRHFI